MNGFARAKLVVTELERLCTRRGMIAAVQSIIGAEVDTVRLLEKLDAILPLSNAKFREKKSVGREEALAEYMAEERVTLADIDAARLLLFQLIGDEADKNSAQKPEETCLT